MLKGIGQKLSDRFYGPSPGWPFAWKDYERRYNNFYLDDDGLSPLSNQFTKTTVKADIRDFHPFGCPVFVLASGLQSAGSFIPKWDPRS